MAPADAAFDGLEREVPASLRARQFLEAHLLAKTATALCPRPGARLPIYVVNAVDLARRRNEMAASGPRLELERLVLPEAHP